MEDKRKMTEAQLKKAKKLAEKLKGKKNIDNPHALARWMVKHQKQVHKK